MSSEPRAKPGARIAARAPQPASLPPAPLVAEPRSQQIEGGRAQPAQPLEERLRITSGLKPLVGWTKASLDADVVR